MSGLPQIIVDTSSALFAGSSNPMRAKDVANFLLGGTGVLVITASADRMLSNYAPEIADKIVTPLLPRMGYHAAVAVLAGLIVGLVDKKRTGVMVGVGGLVVGGLAEVGAVLAEKLFPGLRLPGSPDITVGQHSPESDSQVHSDIERSMVWN